MGACADTAHIGRIGGGAATGLGLVIAKNKEAVGAGLEFGAQKGFVGLRITPSADIVVRFYTNIIEGTDGLIGLSSSSGILKEIIGESLG